MSVLVDTSVWSLALRRRTRDLNPRQRRITDALRHLMIDGRAAIVGPIRQELLSGIRDEAKFERMHETLMQLPHISIEEIDYNDAARWFNACQSAGVSASAIDMLLCAVALRARVPIFTIDSDFNRFHRVLGLRLFNVKE